MRMLAAQTINLIHPRKSAKSASIRVPFFSSSHFANNQPTNTRQQRSFAFPPCHFASTLLALLGIALPVAILRNYRASKLPLQLGRHWHPASAEVPNDYPLQSTGKMPVAPQFLISVGRMRFPIGLFCSLSLLASIATADDVPAINPKLTATPAETPQVHAAEGFVQHEQGRICDQGAGNREAALFTAGLSDSMLAGSVMASTSGLASRPGNRAPRRLRIRSKSPPTTSNARFTPRNSQSVILQQGAAGPATATTVVAPAWAVAGGAGAAGGAGRGAAQP